MDDKPTPTLNLNEPRQNLTAPVKKRQLLKILSFSLAAAALATLSFFIYQEYIRPEASGPAAEPAAQDSQAEKTYNNDYYGFKLAYPGNWRPIIGSFKDGEYYFSPDKINFAGELEPGQLLLLIKTYQNWKGIPFADWVRELESDYFPAGQILSKDAAMLLGRTAFEYRIRPMRAPDAQKYWHMWLIPKDNSTMLWMIFLTDSEKTDAGFAVQEENLLQGLEFYQPMR